MPGFDAEVRASGRGSHALVVPRSVVAGLASRRVRARVNGTTFEATLGAYGGRTFLGLRKQVLLDLGVAAGARVHVELESLPPEPVPEEAPAPGTCSELDDAVSRDRPFGDAWARLELPAQEEYGRWISAGGDETARTGRIARLRHRLLPDG